MIGAATSLLLNVERGRRTCPLTWGRAPVLEQYRNSQHTMNRLSNTGTFQGSGSVHGSQRRLSLPFNITTWIRIVNKVLTNIKCLEGVQQISIRILKYVLVVVQTQRQRKIDQTNVDPFFRTLPCINCLIDSNQLCTKRCRLVSCCISRSPNLKMFAQTGTAFK